MEQSPSQKTAVDPAEHSTKVIVVGHKYQVTFGLSGNLQIHLVDKQRRCSCELGARCPAIHAVVEYLRSGGQRAPDPLPPCPICGAETFSDPIWDGKYTKEPGWRCTKGNLNHFLQAKAERMKEARRHSQPATSEHDQVTGR